jgi:hypothetical protein
MLAKKISNVKHAFVKPKKDYSPILSWLLLLSHCYEPTVKVWTHPLFGYQVVLMNIVDCYCWKLEHFSISRGTNKSA